MSRRWTYEYEWETPGPWHSDDDREAKTFYDVLQLDEGGLCAFRYRARELGDPAPAAQELGPEDAWGFGTGRWFRTGDRLVTAVRSLHRWPWGASGHLSVIAWNSLSRSTGEGELPEEAGCTPAHHAVLDLAPDADADAAALEAALAPVAPQLGAASASGITPLMLACAHPAAERLVPQLLAHLDAEAVRAADALGWTALHWLAWRWYKASPTPGLLRSLLAAGADPDARDGGERTALHRVLAERVEADTVTALATLAEACGEVPDHALGKLPAELLDDPGPAAMVELTTTLLARGATPSSPWLTRVVEAGCEPVLDAILDSGKLAGRRLPKDALAAAARQDDAPTLALLLHATGEDLDPEDPVEAAKALGRVVAEDLEGADRDAVLQARLEAYEAGGEGPSLRFFEAYLEADGPAEPLARLRAPGSGKALHEIATGNGQDALVARLTSSDLAVLVPELREKKTRASVLPKLRLAIEDGADPLCPALFHAAAELGQLEVLHVLHAAGCPADLADRKGRTALFFLFTDAREPIAWWLLEKGVDPKARSSDRETAGDVARRKRCARLLEVYGEPPLEERPGLAEERATRSPEPTEEPSPRDAEPSAEPAPDPAARPASPPASATGEGASSAAGPAVASRQAERAAELALGRACGLAAVVVLCGALGGEAWGSSPPVAFYYSCGLFGIGRFLEWLVGEDPPAGAADPEAAVSWSGLLARTALLVGLFYGAEGAGLVPLGDTDPFWGLGGAFAAFLLVGRLFRPAPEHAAGRAAQRALGQAAWLASIAILGLGFGTEEWMQYSVAFLYAVALLGLGSLRVWTAGTRPEDEADPAATVSGLGLLARAALLVAALPGAEAFGLFSPHEHIGDGDLAFSLGAAFAAMLVVGGLFRPGPDLPTDHLAPVVARQDRAYGGCLAVVLVVGASAFLGWELTEDARAVLGLAVLACAWGMRDGGLTEAEKAQVEARTNRSGFAFGPGLAVLTLVAVAQWPAELRALLPAPTRNRVEALRAEAEAAAKTGDLRGRAEAQRAAAELLAAGAATDPELRPEAVEAYAELAITTTALGDTDALLAALERQLAAHRGTKP